jgi:hypothetical protein
MAESAEEAMVRVCNALLAGDFLSIAADLTPEAYADAMALVPAITGATTSLPESYVIESHTVEDDVHRFRARFKTASRDFTGIATWRQVDGAWRIASIRLE